MLSVARQAGVVIWTIDRPEAKNALDHATLDALVDAVEAARTDPDVRAAVLTGGGHAFVSGGDLRELRDRDTPQDAERFSDLGFELCRSIEALPFPVIAALPGPAIGGGAELALACDMRVADMRAKISFKQVRMGVTTAWGTVPRLVALVGTSAASRLLFTAYEISATEAKLAGLVDEVVENGLARTTALAWASDVSLGSPKAISDMKRLVVDATRQKAHRELERQLFVDTWSGPDHREAVEAYFERRTPKWLRRG